MAPAQVGVENVPLPQCPRRLGLGVDDNLEAVPRLDGRQELFAVLELALLDLAGTSTSLGVVLIAGAEVRALPLAG